LVWSSKRQNLLTKSDKSAAARRANTEGSMREYGVIVFGASGFTGKRVMVEMAANCSNVKWAAAGRSEQRINQAIASVGLVGVDVVVADCGDEDSLLAMCARADVVINCTGPFRFYGPPVVKACIAQATNYVDITGEPEFMEKMELEYDEAARDARVHIVSAAGFDSVPADEGFVFTKEQFGHCAYAESFLSLDSSAGFAGHATTFECVVHGLGSAKELKEVRAALAEKRPRGVPFAGKKLKVQDLYSEPRIEGGAYVSKFPGADASVVKRSELFRSAASGEPQSQYGAYIVIGNLWNAARLGFHQKVIETAISFDFGKKHVLEHPGFWTAGVFSHDGPSEEQMAKTSFSMTFHASGFTKESAAAGEISGTPDVKVVTRVSGPEPGYVATPIFVVAAALTCIEDHKKMGPGGVKTPSMAFKGTGYRQKLIKRGIKFEVLEVGGSTGEAK